MFLTLAQIEKSLRRLEVVHPFFGITFLVVKKAALRIGSTIDFQIDAANKEFLDSYYKPATDSDWYYRVYRISDKNKSWVASDYASSGLQSVNTRTFGDSFLHEKNTDIWGWKPDYVQTLKSHLYHNKRIPAFDLAVWLFRERDWGSTPTAEKVLGAFLEEFSITSDERSEIFDLSLGDGLPLDHLFQPNLVSWDELRTITGTPPDASREKRLITRLDIVLENVRSLVGPYEIPIRPLTILVGENSSGKTTLLAAVSAVCNSTFPVWPGFNEPPYNLGGYETIATQNEENSGPAASFSVGYRVRGKSKQDSADVIARYGNNRGQVELLHFEVKSSVGELELSLEADRRDRYRARILTSGKKRRSIEASVRKGEDYSKTDFVTLIASNIDLPFSGRSKGRAEVEFKKQLADISAFISPKRALSLAPIRSKPSRTYDQVSDDFSPEGAHIPYMLARILTEDLGSKQQEVLISALERFGQESGLFSEIRVTRPLGKGISTPFQIFINPSGLPSTLLDVGYGVSQALPIIVQSVLLDAPPLMLLQQPEVHLHPKAQAALGSFFSQLVQEGDRQFVIETHSDFIVDRIRQEVANGRLEPNAVGILFFHKTGTKTKISEIGLDRLGNIVGAPPNYREFFLREELNLITDASGDE